MSARILRYQVPVDDQVHEVEMRGDIVAVGCRNPAVVEFWAWCDVDYPPTVRRFTVVGTGNPVPEGANLHHGTTVAPGGRLVWHLLEVAEAEGGDA